MWIANPARPAVLCPVKDVGKRRLHGAFVGVEEFVLWGGIVLLKGEEFSLVDRFHC